MAARKNLPHVQKTRDRIKTSMLINRLTDHVFGEVELSPSQVTAALGLIKKTLPDMQATKLEGEITNKLEVIELKTDFGED